MTRTPVPITDKNGRATTVWKNLDKDLSGKARSIPLPASKNPFEGLRPSEIRPNIEFGFSGHEITAYTEGDCWHLAHTVHDLTGWDIYIVASSHFPEQWDHMLVRHPSGKLVDIEGVWEDDHVAYKYLGADGCIVKANDYSFLEGLELASRPRDEGEYGRYARISQMNTSVRAEKLINEANTILGG